MGEKLQCQRQEANEQNHYAEVIVKRTVECTDNQGSWPWANRQHVEQSRNIKCTIIGAICYYYKGLYAVPFR